MTEDQEDVTVVVTAKDPNDDYELAFKVKVGKSVKKIMEAWTRNMPDNKMGEYEFFFEDIKLSADQKMMDIPGLVNDSLEATIICQPIGQVTKHTHSVDESKRADEPIGQGKDKVGDENIPEEKTLSEDSVDEEQRASQALSAAEAGNEQEKELEENGKNGTKGDFLPNEKEDGEEVKEAETKRTLEKENEKMEEEEEKEKEGETEAEEAEKPDDVAEKPASILLEDDNSPLQISVKDTSEDDVLTFRVRRSKSVGKMITAWKSNQPQYKQQCHDFAFYFGDMLLEPSMTFADLPGLKDDSEIIVKLTPKEPENEPDGEEEGKGEKRDLEEKEKKPKKKARVAKEKVEKPAKEKAPPKEKPANDAKIKHEKKGDSDGSDVAMTTKIRIQQENPKRPSSKSNERYEGYKSATTKAEYHELGGMKADWTYDFARGWITVVEDEEEKE